MKRSLRGFLPGLETAAGCIACVLVVFALMSPASSAVYAASQQEGAQLFASSGCEQCHGVSGLGTGKGPTLRNVRKRLTAEQIRRQIKEGGQSMPPFGDALTDPQIEKLIEFLRSSKALKQPLPQPASNER